MDDQSLTTIAERFPWASWAIWDKVADDASGLVGETLIAVKDHTDGNSEICVDDVLDALAAMYTPAAPEDEFQLLNRDNDATPPQRMAYRSSSELD